MKRIIIAFVFISICFYGYTQEIKEDASYLKITNNMWYTSTLFKGLVEKQTDDKKNEILPTIKRLVKCSRINYQTLVKNYPQNEITEKVLQWIVVEERNIANLETEEWLSNPTWQIGFYLVQLDLQYYINEDLCE